MICHLTHLLSLLLFTAVAVIIHVYIHTLQITLFLFYTYIQAILMSGRWHKKLNLLLEFWNSVFIKCYFEAYQNKLALSLQNRLVCYVLFYFKLLFTLQMYKGHGLYLPAPLLELHQKTCRKTNSASRSPPSF